MFQFRLPAKQLLLAQLQLALQVLFPLAQRLGEFQLHPLDPMLLLAGGLLDLTGRVFLGFRQPEGEGVRLLFQLGFRRITAAQGFRQVMRQFGRRFHRGQFGVGCLPARLNDLGFAVLGHFHQFLVLLLHQGRALSLGGRALVVQFLAHMGQAVGPGVLAHLYLAFDL